MLLNEKGRWTEMLVQDKNPWLPLCSELVCSLSMALVFPGQAGSEVGGWWKWENPWLWPWSGSAGQETIQGKTRQTLAPLSWFHILCWAGLWCGFTPQGKQHQCPTPTFHHTAASQSHQRSPGLRLLLSWEDPSGSRAWIPVDISLQSSSRSVFLQEGCHLPISTKPSATRMVQTGYSVVFQYRRLVYITVKWPVIFNKDTNLNDTKLCLSLPKQSHVQDRTWMENSFHRAVKEVQASGTKIVNTVPRKRT